MDTILTAGDVHKRFGGIQAVNGATLDVERSSITALIGPNGAGKTTLFHTISGFFRPDSGTIRFDGERIDGRPPYRIARRGLVRTFQITKALTRMTVLENVMLAAPSQPGEQLWRLVVGPRSARRREREVDARARELLALVRLDSLADDYAGTLSGGQRKLLEFARALMTEPTMIMLDEPMAGVNPTLGGQLLEHMATHREQHGTTFLLIEHDMDAVFALADRITVLVYGRGIATGEPDAIRRNEEVRQAYLGDEQPELDGAHA